MGVIYASAEVAAAAIPNEYAHLAAAQGVIDRVPQMEGSVLTVVHGSVVDGRANVRSDLDVLVTYRFDDPATEPAIVDGIKAALDDIRDETHVKIEANIWPADEPMEARLQRMYDRLFGHHLAAAMAHPQWSVGEPDEKIQDIAALPLDTVGLRTVMFNYLTYKHSGVSKAPRTFDDNDRACLLALQRVLEFPKAFGRKVAQMSGTLHPDGAGDYQAALDRSDTGPELKAALTNLRAIDREYTALLEQVAPSLGNLADYDILAYREWLTRKYAEALPLGMIAASGFVRLLSAN